MTDLIKQAVYKLLCRLKPHHWEKIFKVIMHSLGQEKVQELAGVPPALFKVPPGHFYSCFPDISMVESRWDRIFGEPANGLLGVSENFDVQLELAASLEKYIASFPYKLSPNGDEISCTYEGRPLRYRCFEGNTTFHLDAVILQAMLRSLKPQRVIEIGSGYSSAIMLDIREMEGWGNQELTFVEPYSQDYFFPLLRPEDRDTIRIIEQPLWEVDRAEFESLGSGDLLFIDSSHVAKIGSDVYDYLFNVLPLLKSGVLIHIHDITSYFEVAPNWFTNGWYWNEGAFLRAFLMYNDSFEIIFHSSLLREKFPKAAGISTLNELARYTFNQDKWRWANSIYLRRK